MDDWKETLERERTEKDQFFAEHPHSPIPDDRQESFDGLRYFEPDPAYRFEIEPAVEDNPETLTVETTQDGTQTYETWGTFTVSVDGDDYTLQAYSHEGDENSLWVPFRDDTNGDETYDAGRYLDLDPNDDQDDGVWRLDFNRAYSPFCAYSEAYECPLVPVENWLDVRIEAGERHPPK